VLAAVMVAAVVAVLLLQYPLAALALEELLLSITPPFRQQTPPTFL
jgi:hypothetical protein